jgi:hypothetical protein
VQLSRDGLRAFSASGYEILDAGFAEAGEVVIWSTVPQAPRPGDRFNIETCGAIHDLAVREVRRFPGGWTATCHADQHSPLSRA